MRTRYPALALTMLLTASGPAVANTVSLSGTIDGSEPTFDQPISAATVLTPYDTIEFTVSASGTYSFLSFYPGDTSVDENMDGVLLLYEGSFDPSDPAAALSGSDDYFAGDVGDLGAFDGACVGSNCSGFSEALTAGTTYILVQTTFTDVPTSFGQPTGPYDLTLTGPGNISVSAIPLPAAIWLLLPVLTGLGFIRRKLNA